LHAGRKFAVIQVLGWTVMYKPRWTYESTSTPFDPLSGAATGEPTTTFGVIESYCTFGHLQDWTVCYTWKSDDEEPSLTQVNPPPLPEPAAFMEGARGRVDGDRIERSPGARLACLQHFGTTCYACGFDGARYYGAEAAGLIHVHHVNPLSSYAGEHVVDPVRDLRPLCPNCHYYVHLEDPPRNVETLRIRFQRAQEIPV
jgi:hypothetical protein